MIRWRAVDRASGGLGLDLALYAVGAGFAGLTAATSTLTSHRAWGAIAVVGYAAAAVAAAGQFLGRRSTRTRALVTGAAWAATALFPLLVQAVQRAGGQAGRAQEEVVVVELAGQRLLDTGTPYLAREAIAALAHDERLLGYLPYQPGMALFGLPRAWAGDGWATDSRIWFALTTAVALTPAARVLLRAASPLRQQGSPPGPGTPTGDPSGPSDGAAVLRAVQAATVLPVSALTLATGGDDLPVLALCLLALALCARDRFAAAGIAVGLAGALKLFAWPVVAVLLILALTRGRRPLARLAAGAIGLPVLAVVPALAVDAGAALENLIRFPLGRGLVDSPAQSPFPGHLIAEYAPAGRGIAGALLLLAGAAIAVRLLRRPPGTAAEAAALCAWGLLVAILLLPSTRFGYLLYPAAFAVWMPALRPAGADRATAPAGSATGVTPAGTVKA